jgi:hypothetical protein
VLDLLTRIALSDQNLRRSQIIAILEEIDYPFARYRSHAGKLRPENITVRFGNHRPHLLVCAHYDSVQGSTGANDNAAGVCILLDLIQQYVQQPPDISVEFVFFDLEEREFAGSWAYTQQLSSGELCAAINLDLCGVGDTLIIGPSHNVEQGVLAQAFRLTNRRLGYPLQTVEGSLPGDHVAFEHVGIPAILVSSVPRDDLPLVMAVAQQRTDEPRPSVFDTMHNGPRDSIEVIQEDSMKMVRHWVETMIQHFVSL